MPFYEYQCAACGHHHEELQKVGDRPMRKCPACGRSRLRRMVSAPVFRLKGGGWYETDFKGDKDNKRNLAGEKEPAPKEAPASEKPVDAKPGAKADAKPADKPVAAATSGKTASATQKNPRARASLRRRRSRT